MAKLPKVYILILNYNGWEDTIECLESVFRMSYDNFQVIIVDNNSPNDSVSFIKKWADGEICMWNGNHNPLQHIFVNSLSKPIKYNYFEYKSSLLGEIGKSHEKLTIIQAGSNGGFAAGNNIFLQTILEKDAYVWLLNPDMVVEKGILNNLINCASSLPDRTIIGTVIKDYYNPSCTILYGGADLNNFTGTTIYINRKDEADKIKFITGGSLFTHAKNFKEIGLFPEEYFLYWEETDWCFQASQKDFTIAVCENAVCYDKVGTSVGRGYLSEYYYSLNALRFYTKYNKKTIPFIIFSNNLRIIKRLLHGDTSRVKAIIKATWYYLSHS